MERERWLRLYQLAAEISRGWPDGVYYNCACIVGVFLWSVVHDRPVGWACERRNWGGNCPFRRLPCQSTMSTRLASSRVQRLLGLIEQEIKRASTPAEEKQVRVIDAKPLPIGSYSKDPDARWGRAAGGFAKGYKFYAVWGSAAVPDVWEVHSMNVQEQRVAETLIHRLRKRGLLLGDAIYDSSRLHEFAHDYGLQLLAPRRRKATRQDRRYRQSVFRRLALAYLEGGGWKTFHAQRTNIERRFGNWSSFAGGLMPLPSWVRRSHRVRLWVQAKMLINADRILQLGRLAA